MIDTTNILANNIVFHIRDDLTIRIGSDGVKIDEGLEIDESAKAIFEGVKEHLGAHQKTLSRSGTIYAAYTNSDRTEGRGFQYPKHYARTRATALRLGKNGYVQGLDCPVKEVPVYHAFIDGKATRVVSLSHVYVHAPTDEDEKLQKVMDTRAEALAKARVAGLTDEDIQSLKGL